METSPAACLLRVVIAAQRKQIEMPAAAGENVFAIFAISNNGAAMDRAEVLRQQAEQSLRLGLRLAFIAVLIASLPLLLAAWKAFRGKLKLTAGKPITGQGAVWLGCSFVAVFVIIVAIAASKTIFAGPK
jgi:hypothetical protein